MDNHHAAGPAAPNPVPNPLLPFVTEARPLLLELVRDTDVAIADADLPACMVNRGHREFLEDLTARAAVLAHCYEALLRLTERFWDLWDERDRLPRDPDRPDAQRIPREFQDRENWLVVEMDALTWLPYYEVASITAMLSQIGIRVDRGSELHYMVKIRDRFLAHGRRVGVRRGLLTGWAMPERGPAIPHRDVAALNFLG